MTRRKTPGTSIVTLAQFAHRGPRRPKPETAERLRRFAVLRLQGATYRDIATEFGVDVAPLFRQIRRWPEFYERAIEEAFARAEQFTGSELHLARLRLDHELAGLSDLALDAFRDLLTNPKVPPSVRLSAFKLFLEWIDPPEGRTTPQAPVVEIDPKAARMIAEGARRREAERAARHDGGGNEERDSAKPSGR